MKSFAAWGSTILGLAIIMTIGEMFLPRGRLQKVIRSVFATIAVFVIVTPLPSMFKNGFNFNIDYNEIQLDDNYVEYINDVNARMYEKSVMEYLTSKGYANNYDMSITVDGYAIKSIRINFSETGIMGDDKHIYMNEIVKIVADYFGVDEEVVMCYG